MVNIHVRSRPRRSMKDSGCKVHWKQFQCLPSLLNFKVSVCIWSIYGSLAPTVDLMHISFITPQAPLKADAKQPCSGFHQRATRSVCRDCLESSNIKRGRTARYTNKKTKMGFGRQTATKNSDCFDTCIQPPLLFPQSAPP